MHTPGAQSSWLSHGPIPVDEDCPTEVEALEVEDTPVVEVELVVVPPPEPGSSKTTLPPHAQSATRTLLEKRRRMPYLTTPLEEEPQSFGAWSQVTGSSRSQVRWRLTKTRVALTMAPRSSSRGSSPRVNAKTSL